MFVKKNRRYIGREKNIAKNIQITMLGKATDSIINFSMNHLVYFYVYLTNINFKADFSRIFLSPGFGTGLNI